MNFSQVFSGIVLCSLAALLLCSCVETQRSPYVPKALRVNESIFDVKAVRMADSSIRLIFITSPRIRTPDPNIRWVEAAIGPNEHSMIDTITFSVTSSGAPGAVNTVQLVGDANWDTPHAKRAQSIVADVSVVTATSHLVFRQNLTIEQAVPMEVTPFVQPLSDSLLDLGMMAKRVYIPTGEYLASSENFRVIVSDKKGNVVWRSDAVSNFLSAITKVEPQTINQVHRYALAWNGRDLNGDIVPDAEYKAEILIPCRPRPYQTETLFHWPPR